MSESTIDAANRQAAGAGARDGASATTQAPCAANNPAASTLSTPANDSSFYSTLNAVQSTLNSLDRQATPTPARAASTPSSGAVQHSLFSHSVTPQLKIFAGNANPQLARDIAKCLNVPLGAMVNTRFTNGESWCAINESIRGADVFLIQPTCAPVNDTLMELLIMCDAFKRASARRIVPVMPYFGYARQDKKVRPREPITAKLVADLITLAGADRIFAIDLHAGQIQGFFNRPVDHLPAQPIIAEYLIQHKIFDKGVTVVSPDVGGVQRATLLAERLGADLAIVAKRRPEPGKVKIIDVIGDVENQVCVLIDDMIDSGGTFLAAANELAEMGAREIYGCATHPVLSGDAVRRIQDSPIKELIVTDTIPIPPERMISKITVLSVAEVCAQAILRIHHDDSVSTMFDSFW